MAMLQFGGLLSNATVRITPRASWWTTSQHLLHASSVATNPVSPAAVDSPKDKKIENVIEKQEHKSTNKPDKSLVMSVFKKLLEDTKQNSIPKPKENDSESSFQSTNELHNKINLANNIDELLDIVNHPNFNQKNASNIIFVLSNWATSGKIKINDIQSDVRYKKVCRIFNLDKQTSNQSSFSTKRDLENLSAVQGFVQSARAKKEIDRLNTSEIVSVLKMLATNQKRPTPLLQSLAKKLSNADANLNIKQLGDILYSMSVLNFYDERLMQKGITELKKLINKNDSNAVIGSILTSLSLLRFKDEKLLDELSLWILKHREKIRPQEIISLLLTLANLGYTPQNFSEVFEIIIKPLKESDMCQSKEWLDIVWSLSILNHATSDQYESVLNSHFVNRVLDSSDLRLQTSKILKLLNINAAAQSFMPAYKGPFISEDSEIFKVTILRSDKMGLSNSVISALKILLPSDSIYFNINVNTQMGFVLDAEFCVDKKGTPVAVKFKSDNEKQVFRIGVLTCAYNEFCRGVNEVIGPIQFYKKLLEHRGYKVLLIPYTDVNVKDKIVTRVKYINDNIKILLESDSTK